MPHSALRPRTCRSNTERPLGRFVFKGTFAIVLCVLVLGGPAHGQKRVTKALLNPDISSIHIDGTLVYQVDLETADTSEITVEAQMEGEYRKDLVVGFRESGSTLHVETQFGPEFHFPNDKLGAHKVVSVRMRIVLPHYQNTLLTARSCLVSVSGRYRDLDIVFSDGRCELFHTAENTHVKTASAPIIAHLRSGKVEAASRYGTVDIDPVPAGDHHLTLESTRGDIAIRRIP